MFPIGKVTMTALIATVLFTITAANSNAQMQSVFEQLNKPRAARTTPSIFKEKPVIKLNGGSGQASIKGLFYAELSEDKRTALLTLAKRSQDLVVRYDNSKSQTLTFIEAKSIGVRRYDIQNDDMALAAARSVMADISPVLGLNSNIATFTAKSVERDNIGKIHVRLLQTFNEIPIFGAESIAHFSAGGVPEAWNGRVIPITDLATKPALNADEVASAVYADAKVQYGGNLSSLQEVVALGYDDVYPELIIFTGISQISAPVLAWRVTVRPTALRRCEYFINAITGEIIKSFDNTCNSGPAVGNGKDLHGQSKEFPTYDLNGTFYMIDASRPMFNAAQSKIPSEPIGAIITLDARKQPLKSIFYITSPNNSFSEPAAVSAHFNGGITYEYYRNTHNRNSIDGKGGTITSIIHVADDDGTPMDNAYWNGKFMAYGDGNKSFSNLAGGLDVAAHEMTHGITEHSAGLVYLSQSGALNESMSDVFGCMVDRKDFTMGEEIVNPAVFPSGAMRDLSNPHNGGSQYGDRGWQPAKMSEYVTLPETKEGDNGGVHINSGIPNHAAFLISQSIGREQTEKIYYHALTNYLTSTSQFIDLRLAVVRAAKELLGESAESVAKTAFDKVEIFDGNGSPDSPDEKPVNGPHFLLVHRVGLPFTLAIVNPVANASGNDIHHISRTICNNAPSISDDGSFAVFVAADKTLHGITLDPNNPVETIISSNAVWNSVALSRDGKRLAATPAEQDGTITIFNLENSTLQDFQLYSPTFTNGQNVGLVLGANSLQWDASGQYVLFDALNALFTDAGEQDYADVGLLRAWDKSVNTFSDGLIRRVLPPLGNGENIGNPTFAKTNQSIVAFDYLNTLTNKSAVMAANISKMMFGAIVENPSTIGRPSYSPDDKRMAYGANENGLNVIKIIPLAADRISASGLPFTVISSAVAPVYYAVGQRPSDVEETVVNSQKIETWPNPASNRLTISFDSPSNDNYTIIVYDIFGREMLTVEQYANGMERQTLDLYVASLPDGVYSLRINPGDKDIRGQFVIAR